MAHGTSKGVVDGTFATRLQELETRAKETAEFYKGLGSQASRRPWHTPTALADRDLLDVPALHNPAWDRNNINQLYSESILAGPGTEGGTSGDLIAMKWQADFLAAEERAFRLRHASYARCVTVAHGRTNGHGKPAVSVFAFLRESVQNLIETAKAQGST